MQSVGDVKMSTMVDRRFEESAKKVFELTSRPSNEDLLALYGLYKQAMEGDVSVSKPYTKGMKEMAKWDYWKKLEGKSSEAAKQEYIRIVERLLSG